jgi:hypothetical protein
VQKILPSWQKIVTSDEDNAVVARIDFDAAGEPIYLDPTEEEFASSYGCV